MRSTDTKEQNHNRSSDRIFALQSEWYFQTREYDHGPFGSRDQAEAELERYVCEMRYVNMANCNPAYLFGDSRTAPNQHADLKRYSS